MTSNPAATLPAVVAQHIDAVNSFDAERVMATFAPDAYVNDNRRAATRFVTARQQELLQLVAAGDPCVSWDGRTIYFAGKASASAGKGKAAGAAK